MTKNKSKLPRLFLIVGIVLAVLICVALTAEINIYGLVCLVHHFEPTPNAAWIRMDEERPQAIRVDETTPVYTWQADACNAICCFVTPEGILTERMYTKNGGWYATGWGGSLEYGAETELPKEPEDYSAVRRIRSNGLYGDEIRYALIRVTGDVPAERLVLRFEADGKTYGLLVP